MDLIERIIIHGDVFIDIFKGRIIIALNSDNHSLKRSL